MTYASVDDCLRSLRQEFQILGEIYCDYDDLESCKLDLYDRIQKVYRPEYQNNQRLILVLRKDFYDLESQFGQIIAMIQTVIQDIDISNFFVCVITTNAQMLQEYRIILDTISTDPVPFHIYTCDGEYARIKVDHKSFIGKMQSLKTVQGRDTLSEHHKRLLFLDKAFCIMPWAGINIEPDSSVRPCCEFDRSLPVGNLRSQTIDEIWNSEGLKHIRQQMLSGHQPEGCKNCYRKEKLGRDSLRQSINRDLANHVNTVDTTEQDGTHRDFKISYWDVRYNNLCNFACRSCNPVSSSSLHQIWTKIYPDRQRPDRSLLRINDDEDLILSEILTHIDHVEKIYFAGGEPSMIESFYQVLEYLDAKNKHNVKLAYNLNLSRLGLKQWDLPRLWQKFPSVSVGASLDAQGTRAEYLRVGTLWSDIVENRRRLQDQAPHVDFYVSATTGLINALHVPDFHRDWVDLGLIDPEDFNIQILFYPSWQSVIAAPRILKEKIIDRYQRHLGWLRPLDRLGRASSGYQSIIDLCHGTDLYDPELFWQEISKLDRYHRTDLLQVFPELQDSGL